MKVTLIVGIVSFLLTVICGIITIPILKKIKFGQPILKYVDSHKKKSGTPTMGGLFFLIPAVVCFFIFCGFNGKISIVSIAIGLAFLCVGFLDDFIKIKLGHNEGLKAYQKIIFQTVISLFAGFFAYFNGLTIFYIPFTKSFFDMGAFTVPFVAIVFVAITNSVNLTDGLDGLAGSVSFIYLVFMAIIISLEMSFFSHLYNNLDEYQNLINLSVSLAGSVLGFLIFNVNKAKVFMGDTGSLSLGGFLGAISIFSSNGLFIAVIGIMFVLSSITVIIQVIYFKKTKKRVFLMAPYHHHLQMKGYTETQISFWYSVVTIFLGVMAVIFIL